MVSLLIELGFLGVLAGTLSGLLGIGGGLIVVPGLVYLFEKQAMPENIVMHLAVGTSLAIMILTTLRSLLSHLQRKVTFWPIYRQLLPGVIMGTIVGSIIAHLLHSRVLEIIFAIFVLVVGIRMLIPNKPDVQRQLPGTKAMIGVGLLVGAKSGLLGIGGGALTIPFLTYCNVSIRNAVVVSAATGLTIATIGTISFMINGWHVPGLPAWSTGYVYWPAWLPVIIGSILCAPLGAKLSHYLPADILKRIFSVFLLLVAFHMILPW